MVPIKKIITGFALILCLATSTFAANVTTIALKLNKCFSVIEKMALYEYENDIKAKNYTVKKDADKKSSDLKDILIDSKAQKIINLQQFTNEVIHTAYKIKYKVMAEFERGFYKKGSKSMIKSIPADYKLLIKVFNEVIIEIHDYLSNGNNFLKLEYYHFKRGFNEELMPYNDTKLLFDSLFECRIRL